jgi:hypothetical protein
VAVPKAFQKVAAIKPVAKRSAADMAMDKRLGIKEGSSRDKKIDAKVGVSKYQYGGKKKSY